MDAAGLRVVSAVTGEPVDVDLEGAASVAQLRLRVASALGAAAGSVKLLSAGAVLDDAAGATPEGTVGVLLSSPGPSWYPARKYLHEGKEVLRVEWGFKVNFDCEDDAVCRVDFTDGRSEVVTAVTTLDRADVVSFAKKLVEDLGFVTHQTLFYEGAHYTAKKYEAVPPEDPDEWEEWEPMGELVISSGQRRKRLKLQGTARQADGMPRVPFGLGCRHKEPALDLPNGEIVQCLASDGVWLVVHHDDQVGYVERRDIADLAEDCPHVSQLGTAVVQADTRPDVGFYLGRLQAEADEFIPNGTELTVLSVSGDHAMVQWGDWVGFVEQRSLLASSAAPAGAAPVDPP